jgi:trimethylamine--corrinoid protein Co-methyltransferase
MTEPGLLVSAATIERIHAAALRVLDEVGMAVEHAGLRAILKGVGCRVANDRAYFPPKVVADALAYIPRTFTLYGREIATRVEIGGERVICTNTGIFANILDFATGQVRRSTLADVEATTRLLDAMDNVHVVYVSLVDATEMPPAAVTLHDLAATLQHTTKPLVGPGVTNRAEAEAVIDMAAAVRGGRDVLRRYPLITPFICPLSPLRLPYDLGEALLALAGAGMPLDSLVNPVMGATAPYTLAGTLTQGHAEALALAVMAQIVAPGLPILYQNTPSIADMHSMTSTTGGPETGLLRQAAMLLARRAGIPGCAHGHTSSARLDFQAAEEKSLNGLLIAAARPAIVGGLGALANVTLTAYETITLDNDRYGAILRSLQGIAGDDDHLAVDVIADLAAGGSVMHNPHTLRYLRSAEVWRPRLAVRGGLSGGALPEETSLERARAETVRLLASHRVAALPVSVAVEINAILARWDHN